MKKVAKPAVPAPVAVAAPKVAPKRRVAKLDIPATPGNLAAVAKAVNSAVIPKSASRTKKPVAVEPKKAEVKVTYPVKKTATASLTGSLSAIQQARSVLMSARGIGEALDTLNRLEAQARTQLVEAINGELKGRRVKTDGFNIGTEGTPEGVNIVLTKQ